MTTSIRYWQGRYKLIAVLLGVSPYLAYWFLKLNTAHLLSAEEWSSVALVTTFWSLNNLLVLVYFEYSNRTIKSTLQKHEDAEIARDVAKRDLESLLNGVPYMLGYWDSSLHNRFSNKAYANWFSVAPEKLLGNHISTLMSPARLEKAMPLINQALAGKHCEYTVKLNNKANGQPSNILVQYLPDIVGNEVKGFYAIGQDISDKHEAEQNLKLRKKLLELTSNIANVGSIVIDPNTAEVHLTPEAQRLLCSDQHDLANLSQFCNQFVCDTQRNQIEQRIRLAVHKQEKLSLEFLASDNQKYFGCSGESIIIEDKPCYLMCLMDITESTLTKTRLIEAKNRADQITEAKSQFVAMMSHEIRNPLHTILGLCNLLDEQCDLETQKDLTEKLKYCTEDLVDLLTNSLDSFRMDRGELHFEDADFDLWELIYGVSNHMYGGAKNEELELKIRLKSPLGRHWRGDSFRIKQMVGNLVSNACKFTETGHIQLQIEQVSDKVIKFTVEDTGPGIPEESIKNLFEQLAQSSPSTARLYGGSGLGLNLVKSLVEHIGGTLQIQSTAGQGSIATLYIPLKPAEIKHWDVLDQADAPKIQLAVSRPACLAHAREMLVYMGCELLDQSTLLITDHVALAHAHVEEHPSHHALVLPTLGGRPQLVSHLPNAERIMVVQGPLQPSTLLRWIESGQALPSHEQTSPAIAAKPVELVVLLVEDVKMTRTVIRTLLNKRGIQCLEAENGQKAVEIIKTQGDKIDFVLMDINMPVLNGIDATLQIRSDYRYGDLVVYALTGEDESTTTHSRDWSVFDKVLCKPLKLPALEALLDTHRATKAHAACSTR